MSVGFDNSWKHDVWAAGFSIEVTSLDAATLECEIIGADPALINALRRIVIAEVPTVAIEDVFVIDNTSVMAEEVLAMRLGLVPLAIDPAALEGRAGAAPSERNTVVFKLHVECTKVRTRVRGGKSCCA
jgi:DNA-directed RNA polymerases I and III subunit RPAC1